MLGGGLYMSTILSSFTPILLDTLKSSVTPCTDNKVLELGMLTESVLGRVYFVEQCPER
jgi:hypothetical protein